MPDTAVAMPSNPLQIADLDADRNAYIGGRVRGSDASGDVAPRAACRS